MCIQVFIVTEHRGEGGILIRLFLYIFFYLLSTYELKCKYMYYQWWISLLSTNVDVNNLQLAVIIKSNERALIRMINLDNWGAFNCVYTQYNRYKLHIDLNLDREVVVTPKYARI